MTLNITDAELHEWANMRADDAGRLARELVACRRQSQAAVAAAIEAAAQVVDPSSPAKSCTCQTCNERKWCAQSIRALATPDQIAALAAERAATVVVNPLVWVKSHMTPWRDDWHTVPTAYTIRCCDENGWKWQGNGGHGYESSAKHAMTAVQGIHEAAIRSAITITSGADRAKLDKAAEALQGLVRYQKSVLADVSSAHSNRGAGASEWMREDDRDFIRDLRAAFEVSAAVLAEIGGA